MGKGIYLRVLWQEFYSHVVSMHTTSSASSDVRFPEFLKPRKSNRFFFGGGG